MDLEVCVRVDQEPGDSVRVQPREEQIWEEETEVDTKIVLFVSGKLRQRMSRSSFSYLGRKARR